MSLKLDGTGKITGIDQGLNVVGVGTFSTDLSAGGNVVISGDVVVGGGLTVTGVLTYEDVTNVDSIGVITARSGIVGDLTGNVTGNVTGNITGNVTGNITGNVTGEPTLSGISSSISDTAVDIFVYDTSKDSDGGAWRKRTQHTSWYNETLNTATRGSRREFPAVAVIVATSSKVTIYDGDDPDLPMWMIFNRSSSSSSGAWTFLGGTPDSFLTTVSAINGLMVVGTNQTSASGFAATVILNFLSETISIRYFNGSFSTSNSAFVYRNLVQSFTGTSSGAIISGLTNDVAMTVLSSAPIDSATGLPVPTIAVATDGGVSIIKDDGTVVDLKRSSGSFTNTVQFTDNNSIMLVWGHASDAIRHINHYSYTDWQSDQNDYDQATGYNELPQFGASALQSPLKATATGIVDGVLLNLNGQNRMSAKWDDYGLKIADLNESDRANGMVSHIRTDYNSGWMHGDIKGAFLSDTDATNASVSTRNLITNSTFADTSNWTGATNGVLTAPTGLGSYASGTVLRITNTGGANGRAISNTFSTTVGKQYGIRVSFTNRSSNGQYRVEVRQSGNDLTPEPGTTTAGYYNYQFISAGTGTYYVELYCLGADGEWAEFDDVYVYELEQDRSVNNNGLQVFGTITKSAVATGAELVAYSGWSASNYLIQPYNSDLNFGTSNFCVMGWFKLASNNTQECIMMLENPTGEIDYLLIEQQSNGDIRMQVDVYNGAAVAYHTTQPTGVWIHYCGLRISDRCQLYINGSRSSELDNGFYFNTSFSFDNTGGSLYIGRRTDGTNPFSGQLALWKISSGLPSPEQIKKIYEDEKFLFQENAACTLYGSSNAVTALAYDEVTDRLHVGTSSGRSDFQGLRRINNTTTAVTTAISAHDEFIAEQ